MATNDLMNDGPSPAADDRPVVVEVGQLLRLLAQGEINLQGQLLWSSNSSFLVRVSDDELECLAIYKPQQGERPLWDFPDGTLCLREYAAYALSQALGWPQIPPTVLRDGPYGLGAVQFFVDADPDDHFFNIRHEHVPTFQRVAVFDVLVNNADRKAGHCLRDSAGVVWSIDHGLTFNAEPKLRTVIWDYAGQPIPDDLLDDLRSLAAYLDGSEDDEPESGLRQVLERLLLAEEMDMLRLRLEELLEDGHFPQPGQGRNVPWPMV